MAKETPYRGYGIDGRWHRGYLVIDIDGYYIEEYGTLFPVDKNTVEEINF